MYGPPGVAYVYLVYGMYDCLNIVTEPPGRPAALLVRAVEPIEGAAAMRASRLERWAARRRDATAAGRATERDRLLAMADDRLASGPGLVAAAFELDRAQTGLDLLDPDSPVRLEPRPPDEQAPRVARGPRIGIGYAGAPWTEVPWRLWVAGHPSVSGPGGPRSRTDRRRGGA